MQTILGASGQIARELARELKRNYTDDLRLVSRHPQKVNDSDMTFAADLLDAQQTLNAVKGSDTVYEATRMAGAKFVYFDNTYMYPQSNTPQTEETHFAPRGRKGKVRAAMADRVLDQQTGIYCGGVSFEGRP
jgi:uncharacterized protein YbjT (DUF2867 family)